MKQSVYLYFLLFSGVLFAQNITVKGVVFEKNSQKPIELASITVIDPGTNTVVKEDVADAKGNFNLEIPKGKYNFKFYFFGFKTELKEQLVVFENTVFPVIFLEENEANQLDEVKITVEKSSIEHRLDKKIFNVGKDLLSKGGTVNDILNNVPSVSVNALGAVSLRGNTSVRILINGKPSVLTTNNGLEQIPSDNIDRVEVITNPSAQYDAQGAAGIINIILKKNKSNGFGSSITLSGGIPDNNAIGFNVNYKKEKFNLFSDLRYADITLEGNDNSWRTNYSNGAVSSYLDQQVDRVRNFSRFNLYLGGDYYINSKNTLTLSYYYRQNVSENQVDYTFKFLNQDKQIDKIIKTQESYREPQKANQIELNYIKTFDDARKKFTLNLQYDFWNDDENENIIEHEIYPANGLEKTLKSRDIESSKDFVFQSDYSIPVKEKSKIDVGIKGEIRRIDSDYIVWDNAVVVDSLNNVLHYNENILGAYVQYGNSEKKFQYQFGLRAEYSKTGSEDRNNKFNTSKSYANLFPTVHLSYLFTDDLSLQLSYSRRIDRPSFYQLNPFGGIADRRNIRIGNPDLNPMFINSYELGTLLKWNKFTFNPSVYHQNSVDVFGTTVTKNTNDYLVEKPINLGVENRYGLELNATYSPYKWWFISSDFNFYKFDQKGLFNVSDNTWFAKLNSRIKSSSWSFQTAFNYTGAKNSGQILSKAEFWSDLALAKEFWNDKASLTFKADNIFDSRVSRGVISGDDYVVSSSRKFSGTRLGLILTYRFNRKKTDKDRLPD